MKKVQVFTIAFILHTCLPKQTVAAKVSRGRKEKKRLKMKIVFNKANRKFVTISIGKA